MKSARRLFVILCLVAWCFLPAVARAQEGPREDDAEPDLIFTEIGARFAMGGTTLRPSPDDRMFDIVAYAELG